MPNENTQKCKIFTAQTSKLENGEVATEEVILKNVPTPLFILFSFSGAGKTTFFKAAKFKEQQLKLKYPDAEVRIIKDFEYPLQFKAEWTKLYNELTNSETACKYALWQVHYFGHGNENSLTFTGGGKIYFDFYDKMERLPWHPNEGIFVLHSCRGAAFEDTLDETLIKQQICLAKTISEQQKTRCLGQVTFGSFATNSKQFEENWELDTNGIYMPDIPKSYLTNEDIQKIYGYRPNRYYNAVALYMADPVLWGYALLTGDTKDKVLALKANYEKNKKIKASTTLPKLYPIYQEIKKLSDKNQILPCRVFNKGQLEARIVEVDVFNQNDLEYI